MYKSNKEPIIIKKQKSIDKEEMDKKIENPIIDLGEVLTYLSRHKGKLEVTFQKNQNPDYESLCLLFIKIPVYGPVVQILKDLLEDEGDDDNPLSKGKIVVDKRDDNLYSLVGAIRVKSIARLTDVVKPVLLRMRVLLKEALIISKKDNIGNLKPAIQSKRIFRDDGE